MKKIDKKEIRKYIKSLISQQSDIKKEKALSLHNKIISSPFYKEATTVLSYMALSDEIEINNEEILKEKDVYIPKVFIEKEEMEFYKFTSINNTQEGSYNIKEPKTNSSLLTFNNDYKKILVLVPGRAFTKDGIRLGRGKGYYDKYLSKFINEYKKENITLLGVCFREQILDELPYEAHDIKMDIVLTD